MTALFIPTEFFAAFESGTKDTEYRPYGPRWNERTCAIGRDVLLSHGYGTGTGRRLRGVVAGFAASYEPSETDAWRQCYGEGRRLVACIRVKRMEPNA